MELKTFPITEMYNLTKNINKIPEGGHQDCLSGRSNSEKITILLKQNNIFYEEFKEAIEAAGNNDIYGDDGLIDALGDMLYVGLGFLYKSESLTPGLPEMIRYRSVLSFAAGKPMYGCGCIDADHFFGSILKDLSEADLAIQLGEMPHARCRHLAIITNILQLAELYDIDMVDVLTRVSLANLSKFDRSEDDAKLTQEKYDSLGVSTVYKAISGHAGAVHYVTFSDKDQSVHGKLYPEGKWLKSYKFAAPTYDDYRDKAAK